MKSVDTPLTRPDRITLLPNAASASIIRDRAENILFTFSDNYRIVNHYRKSQLY